MFVEIKNNKIMSWANWQFDGSVEVDLDYSSFSPDKYKVENGEIVSIEHTPEYQAKVLEAERQAKIAENNIKKEVEFIETTFGKLKTQTPLGDLKIIVPNFMFMAELSGGMPEGFLRFYDDDDNVFLSPEMDKEETIRLYQEILIAYSEIDSKYVQYLTAIQNAKTLEELENIKISY